MVLVNEKKIIVKIQTITSLSLLQKLQMMTTPKLQFSLKIIYCNT
jgi:hypothetical protein